MTALNANAEDRRKLKNLKYERSHPKASVSGNLSTCASEPKTSQVELSSPAGSTLFMRESVHMKVLI